MQHIRVLIANEPRLYRDAIATVLRALRPQCTVKVSTPEDLDRDVLRFRPHFVMCNELTEIVASHCLAWIVFAPNDTRIAASTIAGSPLAGADLDLDRLLAAVDQIARFPHLW